MAEIKAIEGRTRPCRVRTGIVDILEDALKQAKEGRIDGLAIVMSHTDGDMETALSPSDCFYRMLGGVAQLQFNMTAAQR